MDHISYEQETICSECPMSRGSLTLIRSRDHMSRAVMQPRQYLTGMWRHWETLGDTGRHWEGDVMCNEAIT